VHKVSKRFQKNLDKFIAPKPKTYFITRNKTQNKYCSKNVVDNVHCNSSLGGLGGICI
jgi:hypothetical protein